MHTQYCIQNKRLDLYFPEHKIAIEIEECGHIDRNFEHEQIRQMMIEGKRGYKLIRINLEAADFNINRVINQVYMHMKQWTIKLTQNSLIDDLSKKLLEAAIRFKSKCKKEGPKLTKKIFKNVFQEYKK